MDLKFSQLNTETEIANTSVVAIKPQPGDLFSNCLVTTESIASFTVTRALNTAVSSEYLLETDTVTLDKEISLIEDNLLLTVALPDVSTEPTSVIYKKTVINNTGAGLNIEYGMSIVSLNNLSTVTFVAINGTWYITALVNV